MIEMKFLTSHIIFVGITIFFMVFAEYNIKADSHVNSLFMKMLRNIIKTNESRMKMLKETTSLKDYLMTQTRMSFTDNEEKEDSMESGDTLISLLNIVPHKMTSRLHKSDDQSKPANEVIFLPDHQNQNSIKLKLNHKNSKKIKDSNRMTDFSNEINEKLEVNAEDTDDERRMDMKEGKKVEDFRRSWMSSCKKKAARTCRKACKEAYKSFCRTYSCSSRAKRRLRTECKYSCKSRFNSNGYSDLE